MLIPKQVILEVTSRCQLRCKGCPLTLSGYPRGDMDLGYFESVIDRIDFPCVVIPWMNGEPLLHPGYADMVRYVTDRKLPMYITTNGHIWHEELFQHITDDTSCYQIIVSLDGMPGSASITAARPGSNAYKVVTTIEGLLDLKRRKDALLDVAVKIVNRGQDWEEIERYILYWLERGVDYVCEGRMLSECTVDHMRRYPCQYYDNNFMVIRWDGRLVLCAYNDQVVNRGANPLGELDATTDLLEVYNGEAYEHYRRRQKVGIYDGPCAACGFAYTGMGMDGEVRFRRALDKRIFYRRDYYNQFYSLKEKRKPVRYYAAGAKAEAAR